MVYYKYMKKQSLIKQDYHFSNYKNTYSSQHRNSWQYYNNIIKKRKKLFFLILLLFCIFICLDFLFFSPFFDIQNFEISKTQNISQKEIEKIALNQTKQKKFFFLNQKNFFVFDKKVLQKNLEQSFSLTKLKIHKEFKNPLWVKTVHINFEERISTSIWTTKNNKCYFLDEYGIIFKEINSTTNQLILLENQKEQEKCTPENLSKNFKKIPIIYNETEENIEINKTIISKKLIDSILYIYKELPLKTAIEINFLKILPLKKMNLDAEKEDTKEQTDIYKKLEKTEISVVTQKGFEIYFDIFSSSLDQQIKNLRKILNQEIKEKEIPSLEYIDLRFGNRIYYRTKE